MKKILKIEYLLVIITAIITAIITMGTTAFAAILYQANQVGYTPSDTTWNVNTVDEALNDLYNTAKTKLNSTTATAEEILSGKVAYSRGNLVTGTMTNRGAVNETIDPGASYTIPAGYHNGSGTVTANVKGGTLKRTLLTHYSYNISIGIGNTHAFTYNASGISGYQQLTADNFIVDNFIFKVASHNTNDAKTTATVTKTYDATTGILTYSTMYAKSGWNAGGIQECDLYLITVE